jgi:hypothetical protein
VRLELVAGDIVEIDGSEQVAEVSSIGSQGRIYFRGTGSGGAWPDQLIVRSRKDDDSAEARELKKQAANNVALSARMEFPSLAKLNQLRRYEVETALIPPPYRVASAAAKAACQVVHHGRRGRGNRRRRRGRV